MAKNHTRRGQRVNRLRRKFTDSSGNIAVPGAVVCVVLMAVIGGSLDLMSVSNQQSSLQDLADNASLAAVQEFAVSTGDEARIKSIAAAYAQSGEASANINSIETRVNLEEREVYVSVTAEPRSNFALIKSSMKTMSATATARLAGQGGNICMIGLSGEAMSTLRVRSRARITAETCGIYSNSSSKNSVSVDTTAEISADLICTVGGYQSGNKVENLNAVEDCTPVADPLEMRPTPKVETCDFNNKVVIATETLEPGTYCGGITIDAGTANLKPGEYILTGGPLHVTNNGTLNGDYVGFYLSGPDAKLQFDYEATVSISAPKEGLMTGLLFFSSPYDGTSTKGKAKTSGVKKPDHYIRSDNARRMVGTIYLPNGKLLIDGRRPIADQSEYTVIIADTFELQDGPNLVLRTDYHLSDIPVPDGVGPMTEIQAKLVN